MHDIKTRSYNMSAIKGKNTKPEMFIRHSLHTAGFRYRLHVKDLPGKPDIVLPKYKAIIMVNGCFWHKHQCYLFKWPSTRIKFWKEKIDKNVKNDHINLLKLQKMGWRIMIVWECALKGKIKLTSDEILKQMTNWIKSDSEFKEIAGIEK